MKHLVWSGMAVASLGGCASLVAPLEGYPAATSATAEVRDRAGLPKGAATAAQAGDGIRLRVVATNMAPGAYGAHVHMIGRCDPPGFESAGGHWNPTNHQHGKDNPRGMHKGDLPNLLIGADGRGMLEVTIPHASLGGSANRMLDADGAALVLHAAADDYRTDPSGSSGARIACGVFR
ncbi:MAG TPA: superoxide dismutase family protein [Allosphingosinicella sp.]|jgi:Cu-Zn family superoxide dismutase